jgi:hypothetical protein
MFHVDTGEPIVGMNLGLTAYLADTDYWAQSGVVLAYDAFLASPAADRLRYYTTSMLTDWRAIRPGALKELRNSLSAWRLAVGRPREHFFFRVADEPNCPQVGFSYTEIDQRRAQRSGVIEVSFPQRHDPTELVRLLELLVESGPLHCAVGGYAARWNVLYPDYAFTKLYFWSLRYWGIDIQVPEEMAYQTVRGLPGANWLTALGEPWARAREVELSSLLQRPWQSGVKASSFRRGIVLQAGIKPTLGDLNQLALPEAYAEAARGLAELFVEKPPEFPGPFAAENRTQRWLRRLVEPKEWA